jgi:aryl-alcohol dehydrogenase
VTRTRIRAAIARAGEPFTIEACELDEPGTHEVRVRIEACGICHTDLAAKDHGFGTPLPAVLGHEGVGRIEAIGAGVSGFELGDRVVISFGACGQCSSCREQMPAYCQHALDFNLFGRRLDGSSPISTISPSSPGSPGSPGSPDANRPLTGHFFGQSSFATHAIASATNLVRVDAELSASAIAPLACGVQTGVGAVIDVLQASPADSLAIFGCGTVGLAAVMAASIVGCKRILAFDLLDARLELARELGATTTINSAHNDIAASLRELGGLTLAFDNTGRAEVIEAGFAALRPRGRMVLAGVSPRGTSLRIDPNRIMGGGRSLRGTIEGDADPRRAIPRMLEWVRSGQLPVERLVTRYPFERINDAVEDMRAGRTIKPVLDMSEHAIGAA